MAAAVHYVKKTWLLFKIAQMCGKDHDPGNTVGSIQICSSRMLLSCVVENRPQKVKLRLISIKCLNLVVLLHTLHCHSKPDRAKISQTKNATRNEQIDECHYDCRLITRHQTHYITGLQSTWQKRESTDVLKIYIVCFEDGKRGRVH